MGFRRKDKDKEPDDVPETFSWSCPAGCGAGGTAATQEDADDLGAIHYGQVHQGFKD